MTGRDAVTTEAALLFQELQMLVQIPYEDLPPAEHAMMRTKLNKLEECFDVLKGGKIGNAKLLVAIVDGQVQVESTATLDVIWVQPEQHDVTKLIVKETLNPLPEQVFSETIHDLLALSMQAGHVDPATINKHI